MIRPISPNARSTAAADEAERIAIEALAFVAGDPELLPRFLALTGIAPESIRTAAREPGFLAGVLQFVLAHEPTITAFAEQSGIAPARIAAALPALPTGDDRYERSS
ncbi:MAG: DUF3572 domain-containing protein [Rhizobiaceae bacterium]|nr:DUF3572 domain-containing protein [Rhizobiaceae bacterium]